MFTFYMVLSKTGHVENPFKTNKIHSGIIKSISGIVPIAGGAIWSLCRVIQTKNSGLKYTGQ